MKQITAEDLRALGDANAPAAARVQALSRLAHWERGRFDHLEPIIAGLLQDPNPMVRGAAIKTLLAGWQREQYFDRAVEMLETVRGDDWPNERSDAAFALGQFARTTGRGADKVLGALVRALKADPDDLVQQLCYKEILSLVAPERTAPDGPEFDRDREVDWTLLEPYIER